MSNTVKFSVDDVLDDVEQAFKGGRTRLFSQTLYQFLPDENKLAIQDFDVIVLWDQCRHNLPKKEKGTDLFIYPAQPNEIPYDFEESKIGDVIHAKSWAGGIT